MAVNVKIEEICNKHKFVIVDTCAFIHYIITSPHFPSMDYKLKQSNISNEVLSFWIEQIPSNPIYTTERIKGEMNHDYRYSKAVKKNSGNQSRELLNLRRSIHKVNYCTNKLIRLLDDQERILTLNNTQKQLYNSLFDKYNPHFYNSSDGDTDLLLSAGSLARTGEVCIISNDTGLLNNWKLFIYNERISRQRLNFYIHKGENHFDEGFFNLNFPCNNSFKE
jgi:hypothetical protein